MRALKRQLAKGMLVVLLSLTTGLFSTKAIANELCTGHFVNPITDICWSCLFPLSLGSLQVVHSRFPDTKNPSSPLCVCNLPVGWRIGISFGYWEPSALVDVTREPFCMVNLGGVSFHVGSLNNDIGATDFQNAGVDHGAFYWVHYYKYPLIFWLEILTNLGCMQHGNFDLAYPSELDPTWHDDEMTFILDPESVLFGNQATQLACTADATKTTTGRALPMDKLFWCLGSQGSAYPLDGSVANQTSPIQAATLEAERMVYKLHRAPALIWDTEGKNGQALCTEHFHPILPKSRYRYELVNTEPDAKACYPFGTNTELWEAGHEPPGAHNNFGFLIWRKRNCCLL